MISKPVKVILFYFLIFALSRSLIGRVRDVQIRTVVFSARQRTTCESKRSESTARENILLGESKERVAESFYLHVMTLRW